MQSNSLLFILQALKFFFRKNEVLVWILKKTALIFVSKKQRNVPDNLQYDAYDDVENFRSALYCLILKRYKLQKAAANRSGFFYAINCSFPRRRKSRIIKKVSKN